MNFCFRAPGFMILYAFLMTVSLLFSILTPQKVIISRLQIHCSHVNSSFMSQFCWILCICLGVLITVATVRIILFYFFLLTCISIHLCS
nr:hypothetical protein Itr_chr04CG26490 [Ipomoea trifida]